MCVVILGVHMRHKAACSISEHGQGEAGSMVSSPQVETGGEAVVMAGMPNGWGPMGLSNSQLDTTLARIMAKANEIGADANVLRRTMVPYSTPGQPDTGASNPLAPTPSASSRRTLSAAPRQQVAHHKSFPTPCTSSLLLIERGRLLRCFQPLGMHSYAKDCGVVKAEGSGACGCLACTDTAMLVEAFGVEAKCQLRNW